MVDHVPIMRLKGEITGKLGKKEIREQRSENEGLTGGERIYFGWKGLTGGARDQGDAGEGPSAGVSENSL
jgi:hypothetical protein